MSFSEPSNEYRPKFRWWWPSTVDADRLVDDLTAMRAAGYGGAEIAVLPLAAPGRGADSWGTPGFTAHLREVLTAAAELDMRIDLTVGPGWPMVSPAVSGPNDRLSQQELVHSCRETTGDLDDDLLTPERATDSLVAVTAARVLRAGRPTVLDARSMTDLTGRVRDGHLRWTPDDGDGRWLVFAFWMRPTGQRSIVADDLLAVDHFSADAIRAAVEYLDEYVLPADLDPLLRRAGGDIFEDSLEINARQLWTPALSDEFHTRRGYDLRPYLPVLHIEKLHSFVEGGMAGITPDSPAEFELVDGTAGRVRDDYYRTLNELYVEWHVEPLRRWANGRGLRYRAQPYGGTIDPIEVAAAVEAPECENLGPLWFSGGALNEDVDRNTYLDHVRAIASAGHSQERNEISIEAHCVFEGDYRTGLAATKRHLDHAFSVGVNRLVQHGYAYDHLPGATWPGWSPFSTEGLPDGLPFAFSDAWGPRQPMWTHMAAFADYVARCGVLLRQGRPRADVALFRQRYWSHDWPTVPSSVLADAGYSYGLVSPAALRDLDVEHRDGVPSLGRAAYRALVLDERALDPAVLTQARAWAADGLPVILVEPLPRQARGFARLSESDGAVRRMVDELVALPTVLRASSVAEVAETLRAADVHPDVRSDRPDTLQAARRSTATGDFYFLFHHGEVDRRHTVSVRSVARELGAVRLLDLWNGTSHPLPYRFDGDRCLVELDLAAGEAVGLSIGDQATVSEFGVIEAGPVPPRHGGTERWVRSVSGWDVAVEDWTPVGVRQHRVLLDDPADWRTLPGLEDVSGVATYRAIVRLPDGWDRDTAAVWLDIGTVEGSFRAEANGRSAGRDRVSIRPLDVRDLLRTGENEIRIEVATTLHNRLVALARGGAPGYERLAGRTPEPAGLLGPVRLIAVGGPGSDQ